MTRPGHIGAPARRPTGMAFAILILISWFSSSTVATAAGIEKVRMASGQVVEALPRQVVVRYRPERAGEARARLAAKGARVRRRIESIHVELITVPPGQSTESFLEQLRRDPAIELAEPNGVMKAFAFPADDPNDPLFSQQFNLDPSHPTSADINIKPAWNITLGDPSVIVAVVDTGADQDNADLNDNIVQGRQIEIDWFGDGDCTDTPATDETLGLCADPDLECAGVGPDQCASDNPEDDNDIDENTGEVADEPTYHGTRTSGIIAAETDNLVGIAGVAPNVSIMPVKALNSWGFGSFFSIAEGITWAADHDASVINLSLGARAADSSGSVQAALSHALDRNCVVVAASGNSGRLSQVNFPASFSGVIAVGSIDNANGLSDFSATGKALDLVAPGEGDHGDQSDGIFGTVPSTVSVTTANASRGTSFAAPQVSGVAALIRSVNPALTWQQVTQYIDFTASDIAPAGFDTSFGFGRLNAGAAVAAAEAGTTYISNPAEPGESFPYPNPFRPGPGRSVVIALPDSLGSEGIEIDIMNLAGEKVRTLSGVNTWDGRSDDGDTVASGLYFYFAKTSRGDAQGKLTLIK